MIPMKRVLLALVWFLIAAAPMTAAAQSPAHAPAQSPADAAVDTAADASALAPAQAIRPAAIGLHVARPRGAILAAGDSTAEAFVLNAASSVPTPLPIDATTGKAILWADYEAVFLPLTAGNARFDVRVFDANTDGNTPLGADHAEMAVFGPARRSGRLAVALALAPGAHALRIEVRAATRAAGAASETVDEGSTVLNVIVGDGLATGGRPVEAPASVGAPSDVLGTDDVNLVAPGPPVGGLAVGTQRGVASTTALGAVNFETGHGARVVARAGMPVHVWSDYEAWWSKGAQAEGTLRLAVLRADDRPAANDASLGMDGRSFVFDGPGPRLLDGTLQVRIVVDAPGSYPLVAVLTTTMQRGRVIHTDVDRVPFTLHVVDATPTTGQIAGTVYGLALDPDPNVDPAAAAASPLKGVRVAAIDRSGRTAGEARSNAAGAYQIEGLAPGAYRVHAAPAPQNYLDGWWKHSAGPTGAAAVDVTAGQTVSNVDFRLAPGGTLSGRVTDGRGQALGGIEIIVGAYKRTASGRQPIAAGSVDRWLGDAAGEPALGVELVEVVDTVVRDIAHPWALETVLETADVSTLAQAPTEDNLASVGRTKTNADGAYSIDRLPAGTFWVRAVDPDGRRLSEYYKDARSFDDATPIRLAAGGTMNGIDFTLEAGGSIAGQVREESQLTVILPLAGMTVEAYVDDARAPIASALTNRNGAYALGPLPPGAYRVRASAPDGRFVAEWWKEAAAAADAQPVKLDDGMTAEHIDFTLRKAEARARIHVEPASTGLTVGERAELSVAVAGALNLGAFEATLRWDPAVLSVDAVTIGDFLGSTGRQVVPVTPVIDNTVGLATFGAASFGQPDGPSGAGALFTLKVTGVAIGRTALTVADDSVLTDVGARPLSHTREAGRIAVTGCLFADLNCDCRIDVEDVMAVAARWGQTDDDPDWDAAYDLDPNGRINIVDVQIVAGRWGMRCDLAANPLAAPKADPVADPVADPGADAAADQLAGPATASGGAGRTILSGGGTVELVASNSTPAVGTRVTFTLLARDAVDLAAFEIDLAADPARLLLVEATLGDFLGSTGRIAMPLGPLSDAAGVRFGGFTLPGAAAPSGDGVLATFVFEVVSAGAATVQVTDGALIDGRSERTGAATAPLGIIAGGEIAVEVTAFLPRVARLVR